MRRLANLPRNSYDSELEYRVSAAVGADVVGGLVGDTYASAVSCVGPEPIFRTA